MLEIKNIHASIQDKSILNGIDLQVKPGEVHAIMGPNGSGKSTLSNVISGKEDYEISQGSITFQGKDLMALSTEERAREGIFMSFQYPVSIPGVKNTVFLRAALNAIRTHRGQPELDTAEFLKWVKAKATDVGLKPELLARAVNDGFSGGEKKRNEIMQMAVLEPKLAILDETDSGLDIDALRVVADGVNAMRSPERSMIVITHYQRLLDYIVPDYVHVLSEGKIIKSGGKELAHELESKGYNWLTPSSTASQGLPTV